MFEFEVEGTKFVVQWRHLLPKQVTGLTNDFGKEVEVHLLKRAAKSHRYAGTVCLIRRADASRFHKTTYEGRAVLKPGENLDKRHGRRLSLERALHELIFVLPIPLQSAEYTLMTEARVREVLALYDEEFPTKDRGHKLSDEEIAELRTMGQVQKEIAHATSA